MENPAFTECAPANLRAELPCILVYFFLAVVQAGSTTMPIACDLDESVSVRGGIMS